MMFSAASHNSFANPYSSLLLLTKNLPILPTILWYWPILPSILFYWPILPTILWYWPILPTIMWYWPILPSILWYWPISPTILWCWPILPTLLWYLPILPTTVILTNNTNYTVTLTNNSYYTVIFTNITYILWYWPMLILVHITMFTNITYYTVILTKLTHIKPSVVKWPDIRFERKVIFVISCDIFVNWTQAASDLYTENTQGPRDGPDYRNRTMAVKSNNKNWICFPFNIFLLVWNP